MPVDGRGYTSTARSTWRHPGQLTVRPVAGELTRGECTHCAVHLLPLPSVGEGEKAHLRGYESLPPNGIQAAIKLEEWTPAPPPPPIISANIKTPGGVQAAIKPAEWTPLAPPPPVNLREYKNGRGERI